MIFFKDFDEVRELTSFLNVNNELESLEAYIEEAATEYLPTFAGATYVAALETKYLSNSLTTNEAKHWRAIQGHVAHLAYYLLSYDANVSLDTDGLHRLEDVHRKSAYQWQSRDFRERRMASAMKYLHQCMLYLSTDKPSAWVGDGTRVKIEEMMLWKLSDWTMIRSLSNWYGFIFLMPELQRYQLTRLKKLMADAYNPFITKLVAGSLTVEEKEILRCAQNFLANSAIADKVLEVPLTITPKGLVVTEVTGNRENDKSQRAASDTEQQQLRNISIKKAKEAWCCLEKLLGVTQEVTEITRNVGGLFLA